MRPGRAVSCYLRVGRVAKVLACAISSRDPNKVREGLKYVLGRGDLLPFPTTCICEQGLSALTVFKAKACNHLDPGHDMRIVFYIVEPCIEDLMKEKLQFFQSP